MLTTAANQAFAMDVWHASQTPKIQALARRLWSDRTGAEDGIQSAVLRSLTREDKYDATRGTLATWLRLTLMSIRQAERSKGYRRCTTGAPRIVCPGDEGVPDVPDLSGGPEGILIAREIALDALAIEAMTLEALKDYRPPVTRELTPAELASLRARQLPGALRGAATCRKLTDEAVIAIRASDMTNAALARVYDVTPKTIGNIRRRKVYKHVN